MNPRIAELLETADPLQKKLAEVVQSIAEPTARDLAEREIAGFGVRLNATIFKIAALEAAGKTPGAGGG